MRYFSLLFLLFLISTSILAQESYTVSGIIKDKKGETLPGAGVFVSGYKLPHLVIVMASIA